MKLTQIEKQFLVDLHLKDGLTYEEISSRFSITVQAVKRALADMNVIDLSWYKTDAQHELLTLLRMSGITSMSELRKYRLVER
jgi:predicted transcriptional regulator